MFCFDICILNSLPHIYRISILGVQLFSKVVVLIKNIFIMRCDILYFKRCKILLMFNKASFLNKETIVSFLWI